MPNSSRFPIVPLSEVPDPMTSIKIGNLEAVLIGDMPRLDDAMGPLKNGAINYEVNGLPHGQKAWILKDTESHHVIRQMHGESEWLGSYATTEDALRALASKLH